MKYTMKLDQIPHGFAVETGDPTETIRIIVADFLTDLSGTEFYTRLKEMQSLFLTRFVESGIPVSQIDHFLILTKGNEATVYINEVVMQIDTIAQKDVEAGNILTLNDTLGVRGLSFQDIAIPDDAGIVFFFSVGWRRGLFFDFRPHTGELLTDIHNILGRHYEALLYEDLFSIFRDVTLLNDLFDLGWFPFIGIVGEIQSRFNRLVMRLREGKSIELAEDDLISAFSDTALEAIKKRVGNNPYMNQHSSIIETGIGRYQHQDYISCISNIWPRIEGILQYSYRMKSKTRTKTEHLLTNMEKHMATNRTSYPSIFFPAYFRKYLKSFYFRNFNLSKEDLELSRHTVGHGVAKQEDFDRKRALIGLLIVDQLGHYLNQASPMSNEM